MMSPWCVRLMPQPDSEPAGARHHRSWKLGGEPGVPPKVQVGIVEKTWRVIPFDTVTPLTEKVKVPLLGPVKVRLASPTAVTATEAGLNDPELNAGPVVR